MTRLYFDDGGGALGQYFPREGGDGDPVVSAPLHRRESDRSSENRGDRLIAVQEFRGSYHRRNVFAYYNYYCLNDPKTLMYLAVDAAGRTEVVIALSRGEIRPFLNSTRSRDRTCNSFTDDDRSEPRCIQGYCLGHGVVCQ